MNSMTSVDDLSSCAIAFEKPTINITFILNPNLSCVEFEQLFKDELLLDSILDYIKTTLVSNLFFESELLNFDESNEIHKLFIDEAKELIIKFSFIIDKFVKKNPQSFRNVDLTSWIFQDEPRFSIESSTHIYNSLFKENIRISKILTICYKLIDLLNTYFMTKITRYKSIITHYRGQQDQNPLLSLNIDFLTMLERLEQDYKDYIMNFKIVHDISFTIQKYFLSIFETNNMNYVSFMPQCIMNIFSSSLYFIEEDENNDFLNCIIHFYRWIPTEFRCKHLITIMKLIYNRSEKMIFIIGNFKPDLNLLIDDIITLYKDYLKNGDMIISDIQIITNFLMNYMKTNNDNINTKKLIKFVSIQLAICMKIKDMEDLLTSRIYYLNLLDCIKCINYSYNRNSLILDSYLAFMMMNSLLTFYDDKTVEQDDIHAKEELTSILNHIMFRLFDNEDVVKYFCSTKEKKDIKILLTKIPFTRSQLVAITKWSRIYNKIKDNDKLFDPLLSCIIVKPCCLSNGPEVIFCDEKILLSRLWTSPLHPYDRSSLTIKELKSFNREPERIKQLEEFNEYLNAAISEDTCCCAEVAKVETETSYNK